MNESFCYSTNEEYFNGHCASREAAVRECVAENDLSVGDTVFTATSVAFSPENHACASDIVDRLRDAAQEHAGEAADGWLYPLTSEQEEDLERRVGIAIVGWLSGHKLHPTFWGVGEVEKHAVTAADLPASPSQSVVTDV
jgi:hypothetical protein